MSMRIISKPQQGKGAFNRGEIIENKPVGFPQDGGHVRPYSNLFYWARARGIVESTIGLHPHQGFEIITFVLEGNIHHFDTKLKAWKPLTAGDVQIIRSGNGIQHAERLEKDAVIFQVWFDPDLSKSLDKEASYNDYKAETFPVEDTSFGQSKALIGDSSPLTLDTPGLMVERYQVENKGTLQIPEGKIASLYIISGSGMIGEKTVEADDFIIAEDVDSLPLNPHEEGMDIFAIYTPVEPGYRTYWERQTRYA